MSSVLQPIILSTDIAAPADERYYLIIMGEEDWLYALCHDGE